MVGVFCPNCGHRNPAGVNFCSSCGASLVTAGPDTSVSNSPVEDHGEGAKMSRRSVCSSCRVGSGCWWSSGERTSGPVSRWNRAIAQAGRHPESDIFLDDITVSRRHAEFVTRDKVTTVRDVGSLNGTYVNRERIEEARLSSGDEVQIGKFKLLYLVATGE